MSNKEDIEFLRAYLIELQKWYEASFELTLQDLAPPSDDIPITSPDEERAARLADDNGFDGSLFRNLIPTDNLLSRQSIRRFKKQIKTIPKIIAKIEKSEEEGEKVSLTDNELQLLYDMAKHENECMHRYIISTATKIPESTLKTILKAFEEKGWIHRPNGPRKGFTITTEGMRIYRIISAE